MEPESLGFGRRLFGRLPILPHGDDHEPQEYGAHHPKDRVDKAGDVIVLLTSGGRCQALYQDQTTDRDQHKHGDQEHTENDADRLAPFLWPQVYRGPKIHP